MWSPGPEILTVAEMDEIDRLAVSSGIPTLSLMENAGRQVANEICKRWSLRKATVLCGPGNNGGDGYVVARHLQARGWPVQVVTIGDHGVLKPVSAQMAKRWSGGTSAFNPEEPVHGDIFVDAVFGAGLSRGLGPDLSQLFEDIEMSDAPVVAVDIPSGIDGDRAKFLEGSQPWSADLCVTFFRKKPAHVLYPARQHCGEIVCADIGIPVGMLHALTDVHSNELPRRMRCDENTRPIPADDLNPAKHKYQRGHCVVVSGPALMTGAARLAAHAALRAGAGLVTVVGDGLAAAILARSLVAIMVREIADGLAFKRVLEDERVTSVVMGPGNGVGPATASNVLTALTLRKNVVVDADALTSFGGAREKLFSVLHKNSVLTPHEGEFERLFPGLLQKSANRIEAARVAAQLSGAVVLLKGADTVVANPQGEAVVNTNAPADLATAGSGDVLAGIIGGLIAQGMQAFEAAVAGAYYHGACGRLAGRGLTAEDLPELLPYAMQD